MWLKLKILLGYVILLLLLVLTIHISRMEQTRRNSLRQDEQELACIRCLTGETYAGLLELSTYGETVSVWDESYLDFYHTKRTVPVTCCCHEWFYRFFTCALVIFPDTFRPTMPNAFL